MGIEHVNRGLLWLACVVSLMLFGCATTGVNRGDINLFTDADEIKIGKDFSREIEKSLTIVNDPEVNRYIDSLGQQIVSVSERHDIPYHFKVVDSEEVNAFALPGGYVYVNRGLILQAENEAELVSVIAHEVAHVVARHGTEQLTRQYGMSVVASLALGSNPRFWEEQAAGLFSTLGLLHYGRKAELEADHLGLQEMVQVNYNPEAMVSFFEKLIALHKQSPGALEKLLSTHPPTQERIDRAWDFIGHLPFKQGEKMDSDIFHRVQARLEG